jgi:UDP-2,3-diacylglucosamine pyrophosphatase LpxH
LADRGVEVIYVPGNHDEALRALIDTEIRGVRILRNLEHETADGRPVDLPPELAWLRSASVGTF